MKRLFLSLQVILISLAGMFSAGAQELNEVYNQTHQLEKVTQINVTGIFCKVVVEPAKDNQATISGKISSTLSADDFKVNFQQHDSIYDVSIDVLRTIVASNSGIITLSLTPGIKVNIENTSGYVELNNLDGAQINAVTTSGKINVANVHGNISLTSKSGTIVVHKIEGNLNVTSTAAEIFGNNLEGNIAIISTDGPITTENVKGTLSATSIGGNQIHKSVEGSVAFRSSTGSIKLSDAKNDIAINTLSGAVNLFGLSGKLNIDSGKGTITGVQIRLTDSSNFTTTEGKVKLKLLNSKEELSFVLKSEKAALIAMGNSKMKKLSVGNGPIIVTGTSKTGGHVYGK